MQFSPKQYDNTPLHLAADAGQLGVVKLLVEYGANPLMQNKVKFDLQFQHKKFIKACR